MDAMHNLGDIYSDQGRLAEAEALYERALQDKEKALGPDHTSTFHIHFTLACWEVGVVIFQDGEYVQRQGL